MARDPERLRRFEREAQAVAALKHPNIVTIYSVEEAEGVHFLTMELVEGRTLAEAYMFQLAPKLGREAAHDLVYQAALASKSRRVELTETLSEVSADPGKVAGISPADYTGKARDEAVGAVAEWRRGLRG